MHSKPLEGRERATGAATGKRYESRAAWHWTVHEGRITGLTALHDTAVMQAAAR
ncbi:MAG: nuclear transport factor 2 family protein [Gemmatimonadales bacterium]